MAGIESASVESAADIREKTYTYLRVALTALLVSLGAAVGWQTYRQGWAILDSVSAYYYTPAQGIFVGALIGLGACMIALRGGNAVDEVFLNLGGMFAAAVAAVPTSRGLDYRTALQACRESDSPLLTQKASGRLDCPTVTALADATRANVENNVFALLIVGALALVAAWFFAGRTGAKGGTRAASFWWGIGTACALLIATAVVLAVNPDWIVANLHFIAAGGLFLCVLVVAVTNAVRTDKALVPGSGLTRVTGAVKAGASAMVPAADPAKSKRSPNLYAKLAWAMIVVAGLSGLACALGWIRLFWLELLVAALFIAFWLAQTIQELPPVARAELPRLARKITQSRNTVHTRVSG